MPWGLPSHATICRIRHQDVVVVSGGVVRPCHVDMIRVCIVNRDRWAREDVAVVAAVESAEPINRLAGSGVGGVAYLAAGEVGECAHRSREYAGSPSPCYLGRRAGAGVELVDPNVRSTAVPARHIHHVQEPVVASPHSDPGKVGAGLEGERGRPVIGRGGGGVAVRGAGDIGYPVHKLSEGHIDAVAVSEARVDPVSGDVFLIDATSSPARVRAYRGIDQVGGGEGLAVIRGAGRFHAVAVGRTVTSEKSCGIKCHALPDRERAITVTEAEAAKGREGVAAVVRRDEPTLLGDHYVRAVVRDCNLELAVGSEVVKPDGREDGRVAADGECSDSPTGVSGVVTGIVVLP